MSSRGTQTGSARRQLTAALLRAWRTSVPREEWRGFDAAALRRGCAAQVQFGVRRRRRQTLLRVTSTAPSAAASAAGAASYSVLELIIDDMPFLVDTLSMTLAQLGLSVQYDHSSDPARGARRRRRHPIAACRDRDWARRRTAYANPGSTGASIASAMRPNANSCGGGCSRRWRTCAAPAATGCGCATQCCELCADISRHPPPLAADVIAESRALLQYMEAHHFTFLGYRESRLRARPRAARCCVPVPGTRPRTAAPPAARHPRRPSPAPISAARCAPPSMLIITKANHRSTVHRPGYLDYVGVKRFDARGRRDRRDPDSRPVDFARLSRPIRARCRGCA